MLQNLYLLHDPSFDEELRQKLVASGKQTYGPFAASDFFGTEKYHSFDAVLAMYYDQGVAPLKALSAAIGR